ncbi:hypothetical protein EC973_004265 [Apophysomyces ossiformis]|uniref:Uncharacterized protein n=1 Tax=Apophysomyces ossiformis TaxID=679940 RepID=A0A8H7BQD8_9FUNG|nr:hypothetical protein EC973_004265 [Apophysomyces ossiformis]
MASNPAHYRSPARDPVGLGQIPCPSLDDPRVCGILVKGYIMETYVMDCCHLPVYRHLLLDSVTLPSSATLFALFPSLFRSLLQVKNIAA